MSHEVEFARSVMDDGQDGGKVRDVLQMSFFVAILNSDGCVEAVLYDWLS